MNLLNLINMLVFNLAYIHNCKVYVEDKDGNVTTTDDCIMRVVTIAGMNSLLIKLDKTAVSKTIDTHPIQK